MKRFFLPMVLLSLAGEAQAQSKLKAAREAAEWLVSRFGAKAGKVGELTGRIEIVAAKYGDDAIAAVRKGGPTACDLIEANGAKAVKVLTAHGELGATRVLSRPTAMRQFVRYGDDAAEALVKHPGVAEDLVEKAGAPAVQALAAVGPQNGRRVAMLMEGEFAKHPEVLGVVAKHGDKAANFLWDNKGALAGGAALTAFLLNPEPYLNGTNQLVGTVSSNVVKPAVEEAGRFLAHLLYVLLALAIGIGIVAWKRPQAFGAVAKLLDGIKA